MSDSGDQLYKTPSSESQEIEYDSVSTVAHQSNQVDKLVESEETHTGHITACFVQISCGELEEYRDRSDITEAEERNARLRIDTDGSISIPSAMTEVLETVSEISSNASDPLITNISDLDPSQVDSGQNIFLEIEDTDEYACVTLLPEIFFKLESSELVDPIYYRSFFSFDRTLATELNHRYLNDERSTSSTFNPERVNFSLTDVGQVELHEKATTPLQKTVKWVANLSDLQFGIGLFGIQGLFVLYLLATFGYMSVLAEAAFLMGIGINSLFILLLTGLLEKHKIPDHSAPFITKQVFDDTANIVPSSMITTDSETVTTTTTTTSTQQTDVSPHSHGIEQTVRIQSDSEVTLSATDSSEKWVLPQDQTGTLTKEALTFLKHIGFENIGSVVSVYHTSSEPPAETVSVQVAEDNYLYIPQ